MKKRIISCILVTVILIAASAVPSFAEGGLYGAVSILSESPRAGASADETLDMRIVRGGEYYSIVYEQVNGFKTGWKNVSGTLVFGETYTYTVLLRNDDPYSPYDYEIFLINDQTPYDWYSFEYRGHCYLALFCRFTVAAGRPTFYADGWFYQENNAKDGVAVIASDDANSAVIAVPETLDGKVVTGIGAAFRMCFSVKEVRIPSTVRSIASGAFFNYGDQLAAVTADENNPHFASVDGILYDKEITTLIAVPCGKGGEIIIPEGVASLDPDSFLYNKHITSLSFPSTLSEIPDYTLIFMDAVTTVTLSAGITHIGTGAFWGCESITDVYFHGTRAEWSEIKIEAGNDYLRKAELHCDNPFVDAPTGEWYTAAAIYCAACGYIKPTASYKFMPKTAVDRRAFISILARIDGADISQYEPGSFGDLAKNDSCAQAATSRCISSAILPSGKG